MYNTKHKEQETSKQHKAHRGPGKRPPERIKEMEMFYMIYWLRNQSKMFSAPKYYETDDREDFIHALEVAKENGYEIEYATEL